MSPFGLQLLLWLAVACASVIAVACYVVMRTKEKRFPAACEYVDLESRLAAKRAELADLVEKSANAGAVLTSMTLAEEETNGRREWMQASEAELLRLEGEREQQERLRQDLAARQEQLNAVAADHQRLLGENTTLSVASREAIRTTDQAVAERKALNDQIGVLKSQLQQTDIETASARTEHEHVCRRVNDARLALENAEVETARLRGVAADEQKVIALLQAERGSLERAAQDVRGDIASATEKLATLTGQLRTSLAAADEAVARERDAAAKLQRVELELRGGVDELVTAKQELAAARRIADEEETRAAKLRCERDVLNSQIATLTAALENMRKDLEKTGTSLPEGRLADLWEPYGFPPLPPSRKPPAEQDAIRGVAEYLIRSGLTFPPRVLYAFHTALKVADISPMVVLAGISGTGKSQLPRLYAEGMGMHFLMVSVQPRWDSPQDLLGFYNYLEKQYKATELARALMQFERHNTQGRPKDWNGSRSDRMLLVLLDEMNLARVEYYFSEFLSRLEARRGVDLSDPKRRRIAEIAIDVGGGGNERRDVRILPDHNVLFAGTMNEDESTQSLSDKVLDRACVLRFGRPRHLGQNTASGIASPPNEGLPYDAWRTWLKSGETVDASVSEMINELNDAMDSLHKPFAHRVDQAIRLYVANYPQTKDRAAAAMADQIEQRILPKLRGTDVRDSQRALDKVLALVGKLGEPGIKLQEAFKRGRESGDTFVWRGVDHSED